MPQMHPLTPATSAAPTAWTDGARTALPYGRLPAVRAVRVCHVMTADLWAGAEVQVATTAAYLVDRPEVVLTAVLFNDGPLAVELSRLGVPVEVVDERQHGAAHIVGELTRVLRLHAVDVVHTHRYKDTVLGAAAAKLAGVPHLVRTVHGRAEPMRGWSRMKFRAYDALDRLVLRWCADGMIAVSKTVAADLEPLATAYSPVMWLPNGIHLERVRPTRFRRDVRHELGVAPGAPLIGVVGRLSAVKGTIHFLEAARLILDACPEARFLVVGTGELADSLSAKAAALGLGDACRFLGARSDVYDLVCAMDVFVLPSLDEGIPMALLEAMTLRTPVVASNVGGVPEVITDGVTGLLVPPADARSLASACLSLAGDRQRAQALATRAREVIEARFSHTRNGDQLLALYQQVMARGSEGSIPARFRERLTAARPRLRAR